MVFGSVLFLINANLFRDVWMKLLFLRYEGRLYGWDVNEPEGEDHSEPFKFVVKYFQLIYMF